MRTSRASGSPLSTPCRGPRRRGSSPSSTRRGASSRSPTRTWRSCRSTATTQCRREEVVELNPADAQAFGVQDGDLLDVVTPLSRVRGRARVNGILPGVVAVTTLFGELATDLQNSEAPDPALRVPGLDVMPARLEKASG